MKEKFVKLMVNNKLEIAILFFTFLYLAPIIKCNFISDDGIYYFLRGQMILTNEFNIFNLAYENVLRWISRGRFFPLSVYALFIMYFLNNNFLYKIGIIIAVCINVFMFGSFMEELTESKRTKLLLMLMINLFFQVITVYHSPLLSFHMFMQVMFAILILTLINLQRYLKNGKRKNLILSILFFTTGLLTYELGFAFIGIIAFFIIYYKKNIVKSLKLCFVYAIPLLIIGILNILIKLNNSIGYDGVAVSMSLLKIIITLIKQCYAAIPLSNFLVSKNNGILHGNISAIISNISIQDILITILFLILYNEIIKNTRKKETSYSNKYFLLFCLALYIFPGVLSSLTVKYQNELGLGVAHITVYIQYFGLILCFLYLYESLSKLINNRAYMFSSKIIRCAMVLLMTVIVLLNQQNARLYIEEANLYWRYPKEAVQGALELNILRNLTEEDKLTVLTPYAWESSEFYTEFSSKKVQYTPIETIIKNELNTIDNSKGLIYIYPDNTYAIRYYGDELNQEVYLGKIESIYVDIESGTIIQLLVSNVILYTNNTDNHHILYQYVDDFGNLNTQTVKNNDLLYIDGYANQLLYQINNKNNLIDFNTTTFINHYTKPAESISINYKSGIHGLETLGQNKWRWCEKDAEVEILNISKETINAEITITVSNDQQDYSLLYLYLNDTAELLKYNYLSNKLTFNSTLYPGSNILKLSTDAPKVFAPNDPRSMYFKINNLSIEKTE